MTDAKNFSFRLQELKEQAEDSFLPGAQFRVLQALSQLKVPEVLIQSILHPSFTAEFRFPVMFKGKTYMCLGFRSWFDDGRPYSPGHIVKGGIRYLGVEGTGDSVQAIQDEEGARKLALDDAFALGLEMLAKNSGVYFDRLLRTSGLVKRYPILKTLRVRGGSKGIIIGPRSSHLPDHNEFVRAVLERYGYSLGLKGIVGWDRDVPAGDIATTGTVSGSSVLDGFVDGYSRALQDLNVRMSKNLIAGVITGKTADKRYLGNAARSGATGFGTVEALRVWAQDKKKKIEDLRVVFDGSGNVALGGVKLLIKEGIKVLGLTDSRTVVFNRLGFTQKDVEEIGTAKSKRQSLGEWAKSRKGAVQVVHGASLAESKVSLWKESKMDVLFLSSAERIINKTNVGQLPEGILIIDGANGPVTPMAEEVLPKKNIDHLPGSFSNSGGVTGSLIEWAANIANIDIPKAKAEEMIRLDIRLTFKEMKALVRKRVVHSLVDAFYYLATKRVVEDRNS